MADGLAALQQTPSSQPSPRPARILVVEDDAVIAEYLSELVRDTGGLVLGPVGSVADALDLLRAQAPDAALLDYGLSDGSVVRVTDALIASGVPFALSTGLAEYELPADLAAAPRLAKPFGAEEVERVFCELLIKGGSEGLLTDCGLGSGAADRRHLAGLPHPPRECRWMPRHRLRDATWASLHAKLRAVPGIWKRDLERLRQCVEAVVDVLCTGIAWEDLPERFGKPNSRYRRFRRWSQQGIWDALFTAGVPEDALETVMVDATITKAQRFASGARGGGEEDLGRSRGGLTTIIGHADDPSAPQRGPEGPRGIHTLVDHRGRPLCYLLTPGQAADCRHAESLLEGVSFAYLIGDRAYDTDTLRAWCAEHGVEAVIPSKRNRKVPIPHDQVRYRTRHRIENLFGRVKDYTRIILRKDKTSRSYAGFVSLAFALINIQLCP